MNHLLRFATGKTAGNLTCAKNYKPKRNHQEIMRHMIVL